MFKAIVTICTMIGQPSCTELYNPNIINRTEEECRVVALDFIEYMQRNTPYPIMVTYRCVEDVGV